MLELEVWDMHGHVGVWIEPESISLIHTGYRSSFRRKMAWDNDVAAFTPCCLRLFFFFFFHFLAFSFLHCSSGAGSLETLKPSWSIPFASNAPYFSSLYLRRQLCPTGAWNRRGPLCHSPSRFHQVLMKEKITFANSHLASIPMPILPFRKLAVSARSPKLPRWCPQRSGPEWKEQELRCRVYKSHCWQSYIPVRKCGDSWPSCSDFVHYWICICVWR